MPVTPPVDPRSLQLLQSLFGQDPAAPTTSEPTIMRHKLEAPQTMPEKLQGDFSQSMDTFMRLMTVLAPMAGAMMGKGRAEQTFGRSTVDATQRMVKSRTIGKEDRSTMASGDIPSGSSLQQLYSQRQLPEPLEGVMEGRAARTPERLASGPDLPATSRVDTIRSIDNPQEVLPRIYDPIFGPDVPLTHSGPILQVGGTFSSQAPDAPYHVNWTLYVMESPLSFEMAHTGGSPEYLVVQGISLPQSAPYGVVLSTHPSQGEAINTARFQAHRIAEYTRRVRTGEPAHPQIGFPNVRGSGLRFMEDLP